MVKKRKITLGKLPSGVQMTSRRVAREITGKYHEIQNELEQIDRRVVDNNELPNDKKRKKELKILMEANGGVDKYQKASIISTIHFKTSRWVVRSLQEEPLNRKPIKKGIKLVTLEVGAINTQLQDCPWLNVRAIDLNSQHRKIEEKDMMTLEKDTFGIYDVVLSSMVINCVSCPFKRFEMLARLSLHIKPSGVLFIILPKRCINSPLLGSKHFSAILTAMGLKDAVERRHTPKLTFFTLIKDDNYIKYNNDLNAFIDEIRNLLPKATKQYLSNNKDIWSAPPSIFCMSTTPK
jgi:25S rRNA (adenine2142-N1)-methyltransferase